MQARINNQGDVVGQPTPSQEKLIASVAFQLGIQLYKTAVEKGQRTASDRLQLINQSMKEAADKDSVPTNQFSPPIACM